MINFRDLGWHGVKTNFTFLGLSAVVLIPHPVDPAIWGINTTAELAKSPSAIAMPFPGEATEAIHLEAVTVKFIIVDPS